MEPINYSMDVVDPITRALQGYASRVEMQQRDRALGMDQQRIDLAQQAFLAQQQQEAQARAAAEAQAQQEATAQRAFADYLLDPAKTYDKTVGVIKAYPQLADEVMQQWQGMTTDQQAGTATFAKQLTYALGNGNTAAATQLLTDRANALESAGDAAGAATMRASLEAIKGGKDGVQSVLGMGMASLAGVMSPSEMKTHSELVFGQEKDEPDSIKSLRIRAREAGYEPGTPEYSALMAQGGSGPQVVVNTGEKSDEAFGKKLAEGQATMFQDLLAQGANAKANVSRVERLRGLLNEAPSGIGAIVARGLGEYGIATEGLDEIQATEALINQLVPEQRQPGSGPMSDKDLALFKASLPRLINQPGGNKLILDTMAGLLDYQIKQAEISEAVVAGDMTRQQGVKALMALPNPLQGGQGDQGGNDAAFVEAIKAKVQRGESLTPDEVARVRAIMAKGGQ
jgi:hypothetical protein